MPAERVAWPSSSRAMGALIQGVVNLILEAVEEVPDPDGGKESLRMK